ncbi:7-carboxy-7-deazaguanine synthase [hydrothermal vent metagenome]|uniref:7-carboxy-7-deazaguanine synthase n=1 Tax=hydrothermal vent metagenome TaxID=652676 RepID=A0A3B0RAI9_9ZZZZ
MTYSVKEIFYSLQGEGHHTGRPAVFCRFAGCNFWSGREKDRARADCSFCDTDFLGTNGQNGGKFTSPEGLAEAVRALWQGRGGKPYVICTGGEPLMQLDLPLIRAFQEQGFEVAVESNGSLPCPLELDWTCISPKRLDKFIQTSGDELKLVFPQDAIRPEDVAHMDFRHFYLQPLDEAGADHTKAAVDYCLNHPQWCLSLQSHKILGID